MQKVIENAVLKVTQAMEKNRKAYNEAKSMFNDTGYDRYQKKMDKLDSEYEELNTFLHPTEMKKVEPAELVRLEELEILLKNIKGKWFYIKNDLPASADTMGMDDLIRDID